MASDFFGVENRIAKESESIGQACIYVKIKAIGPDNPGPYCFFFRLDRSHVAL